ncbi:MAG: LptA/OstA family protein [Bacteroidota bacterium]|nr:LptA/OstA family protein [Bacteroidota bacterium]MDP4232811.1 LptA/OstA family protein [Bacteroidota bacterium]MDP4242508.1 LptA/OstA family protein [Bacteroidota bacterium]MDP4289217.1 LptA/OstA family protein [Bacteroidota bacterium]
MKALSRAILLVLTLASVQVGRAQDRGQIQITGDSLVAGDINGQPVEQIIGHFQFVQGPLYGSADKAIKYTNGHRVDLIGNVAIHQDTLSLYAPRATYNDSTHLGHADGGVRLFDRDIELTASEGDYDMDNQIARFRRHVTITQGKTTSVSDSLVYYRATQTTILLGHAEAKSDSGSLSGDTIIYLKALDETTVKGNVHLANDSLRLSSDWLLDARAQGQMRARGHVAVEDIPNQTTVFGDTLARFAKLNYMIVPRRPLLEMLDSSQVRDSTGKMVTHFDTTFLRADTMKIFQGDSARFVAIDSVRLLRLGFSLIGGTLVYDQAREVITVSHSARQRVWNDSTEINADSIAMTMRDRHIQRIYALRHAFATSPVDSFPNSGRIHQLEGDSMVLIVTRDTARQLYDLGNALSIYFLISDGKPDGVNRSSGDTIRMDFKGKSVERLAILSGTEGEYFPERFVGKRAKSFRLADYERHTQLRPRREEFVLPWELPAAPPPTPRAKPQLPKTPKPGQPEPTPKPPVQRKSAS